MVWRLNSGTTKLPLDHRSLDTINLFKKHLKTDLFKKAYKLMFNFLII